MNELVFKTIHECSLELVAHSVFAVDETNSREMDYMPATAARVSFNNDDKTGQDPFADVKLINYLAKHKHMTPFEYQHATFMIECPLFIRSQIHRHRQFYYNEISRRYTSDDLEFWIPDVYRTQSVSNKQASAENMSEDMHEMMLAGHKQSCIVTHAEYEFQLGHGVSREIARSVLPQALLTRFYMGGSLRAWAHFLELRLDSHAQFEVQVIAQRIHKGLSELWPVSTKAIMTV